MYNTTEIEEAVAAYMPRLVEGIRAAERNQSISAYMQLDIAAAVEAFCETLIDEATFQQSRTNCADADDDAESAARHQIGKALALWRIREFGMTGREIRRVRQEAARLAREVSL
jgi:hypothetical protein